MNEGRGGRKVMARSTKLIGEGSIVRVGTVHDADRDGENNIMPGR